MAASRYAPVMRDTAQRLRPQVILLGLVSLLNDAASEMIYPLLPLFLTATLGATPAILGMIEGAADGLSSILKLIAGSLSDRMPRRKPLIVAGYALAAISRGWIAAAGRWASVFVARLVDRAGKGIRSAPRDALIADVTPAEGRGKAFGFHRALDHTGAIVGPLLALALLQRFDMRQVFWFAVIPGAIGTVLVLIALREEHRGAAVDIPPATAPETRAATPLPPRFWGAIVAVALFSLANSSDVFLLLQAHTAGISTAMLPLLWSSHHVIKSVFSMRAGALSDRIDRRHMLIIGWAVYAVIYFVFPAVKTLAFFFALFIVYAIPFTLTEAAERAWISDIVPPEARGRSFGYFYLANGLCVLAGSVLFGWIYDHISIRAAFYTGAALALAAAGWVAAIRADDGGLRPHRSSD